MLADVRERGAVAQPARNAVDRDRAGVFRSPEFADPDVGLRLRCVQVGVVRSDAQLLRNFPLDLGLDALPAARVVEIDRRPEEGRRREDREDFVVQSLTISGDRCRSRSAPVTKRSFEAARAFRLERRVPDEVVGKEPIEVEESRLSDPFTVGAGDGEAKCLTC